MSLLPPKFSKSVVYIETNDSKGTGFIIGAKIGKKDSEGKELYMPFLVTNKHVINQKTKITVHIDTEDGLKDFVVNHKDWFFPKKDIDLALVGLNWKSLRTIKTTSIFIEDDHIVSNESEFIDKMKPGLEVFLLGFPLGIKGLKANYPIVRQGIIARNDEDLIKENQFYLDINNFPGNSGGPIFIKPSVISLEGQEPINKSMLIGVISAYMPYRKVLFDNTTNPPQGKMIIEENSGIAIAIPIHLALAEAKAKVKELLLKDKGQEDEEKIAKLTKDE